MHKVISVKAKSAYILEIIFNDGTRGELSIADRLYGPVFEPLKDPKFFEQVQVDSFGAVRWPNGADLAPDALYREIASEVGAN